MDEALARGTLADLERKRQQLLVAFVKDPQLPGQIEVVLLRDEKAWKELMPEHLLGMTSASHLLPLMVLGNDKARGRSSAHMHELFHHLHSYFARVPLWMEEGLATFYETVHVDDEGRLVVGEAASLMVGQLHFEARAS